MAIERVAVTGGCGFIGTNVCEVLIEKGYQVVAFDNLQRNGVYKNKDYLLKRYKQFDFVWGDVRNEEDFEQIGDVDAIIHLAANPGIPRSLTCPKYDFKTNAMGTINTLEFAKNRKLKALLFASTNKVYSDGVNQVALVESGKRYDIATGLFDCIFIDGATEKGFSEDFAVDGVGEFPHSPYGCSKYSGDIYCQEYYHAFGVPTVVNRMSCIYGKFQRGVCEQGWASWFCLSKLNQNKLDIFGNGKQVRDVLFGRDVAELYELELRNIDVAAGHVFNVGGGIDNSVSLLEVIEYLNRKYKGKIPPFEMQHHDWRLADHKLYISDTTKVTKTLGWSPKTTVWDGFSQLCAHIEENRAFYED